MNYLIVVEKTGTGHSAYSPDLPGCVATGKTRQEKECTPKVPLSKNTQVVHITLTPKSIKS